MGSNGRVPILLVEGDPAHLAQLEPILSKDGEEVVCARSVQEAVSKAGERDYAAILLESRGLEVDGQEIALAIRRAPRGKTVPIVFLDADSAAEMRVLHTPGVEPVDFVPSSRNPEVLLAKVHLLAGSYREHQHAEELGHRMACFSRLLNGTKDTAVIMLDGRGHIHEWPPSAESIFGYTQQEVLGEHLSILFNEEERKRQIPQKELEEAAARRMPAQSHWHVRKDGSRVYVTGLLIGFDLGKGVYGYAKLCRDETAARLAQEAVCESEERFRLVAHATSDVIYDWNCRTNAILWNEAMHSVFGYTPTEFSADIDWWSGCIHPDDRERVNNSLRRAIAGKGWNWQEQYRFRRANGTYAVVLDRGRVLRDDGGGAIRMIGSMVDITLRQQNEEELRRTRDLAVEASQAKSQFLATMSHELRSPLTAIIGYAELLDEELVEAGVENLRADLDKIRAASDHLLIVISDILDLSKIEAGKFDLLLEDFDLSQVLEEAVATIMPQAEKSGLRLAVDSHCENTLITADETRVRQILINILSNAVKFTHEGEIVTSCQRTRDAAGEEWVSVSITDTGIGMSQEQVQRLFQSFGQLDASFTRRYGGTGLGLAISRRLAELMGGSISVSSELGKGSTFVIRLPTRVRRES